MLSCRRRCPPPKGVPLGGVALCGREHAAFIGDIGAANPPDLQNMCLDAHFHESTGRGGGRWTASPGVDSRCGRVDSFGRARSARRKFSTRMRSCRTCVQTLMIMSGQLGPGRVDSGRCHEWTVRQLLQVGPPPPQVVPNRGPRDRAPEESGSTTQEQSWSRRRATVV